MRLVVGGLLFSGRKWIGLSLFLLYCWVHPLSAVFVGMSYYCFCISSLWPAHSHMLPLDSVRMPPGLLPLFPHFYAPFQFVALFPAVAFSFKMLKPIKFKCKKKKSVVSLSSRTQKQVWWGSVSVNTFCLITKGGAPLLLGLWVILGRQAPFVLKQKMNNNLLL